MAEIKATIGTKMSDAEQSAVDPKDVGKLAQTPAKAPVEAQSQAFQICPYCGAGGWGNESPYVYRYFTCHNCGRTFRS